MLAAVCIICCPSDNSKRLSYASQLPTDDPGEKKREEKSDQCVVLRILKSKSRCLFKCTDCIIFFLSFYTVLYYVDDEDYNTDYLDDDNYEEEEGEVPKRYIDEEDERGGMMSGGGKMEPMGDGVELVSAEVYY